MTEAEWLTCENPWPMLLYLHGDRLGNFRKLRLAACACLRRIWHLLTDERCRNAVEMAEKHADNLASDQDVIRALNAGLKAWGAMADAGHDGNYQLSPIWRKPFSSRCGVHAETVPNSECLLL